MSERFYLVISLDLHIELGFQQYSAVRPRADEHLDQPGLEDRIALVIGKGDVLGREREAHCAGLPRRQARFGAAPAPAGRYWRPDRG